MTATFFWPNARRRSLVVGTFFGHEWSATDHTPGVTGPLEVKNNAQVHPLGLYSPICKITPNVKYIK